MGRWEDPAIVEGFAQAQPNGVLMRLVEQLRPSVVVDVGCGAGRNAAPIAATGCLVIGTDSSLPMLVAARARDTRLVLLQAGMHALPIAGGVADLVVAHGIWNLAQTDGEARAGMAEAARVSKPGGILFVYTFSRETVAAEARPCEGQTYVFIDFSGEPQTFFTEAQLDHELGSVGFERTAPVTVHNRPGRGIPIGGGPVIFEATFRRVVDSSRVP